jgi:hypothetical protein
VGTLLVSTSGYRAVDAGEMIRNTEKHEKVDKKELTMWRPFPRGLANTLKQEAAME